MSPSEDTGPNYTILTKIGCEGTGETGLCIFLLHQELEIIKGKDIPESCRLYLSFQYVQGCRFPAWEFKIFNSYL